MGERQRGKSRGRKGSELRVSGTPTAGGQRGELGTRSHTSDQQNRGLLGWVEDRPLTAHSLAGVVAP